MHAFEDTINQYLNTMGVVITQPFSDFAGTYPVARWTLITHMNLTMGIFHENLLFFIFTSLGYLPKQNVASLFRRLLNLNSKMGGPYFYLGDNNAIQLTITRQKESLDLVEFKWMLDQIGGMYWQFAPSLVQEFQIPQLGDPT